MKINIMANTEMRFLIGSYTKVQIKAKSLKHIYGKMTWVDLGGGRIGTEHDQQSSYRYMYISEKPVK